MNMLIKMFLFSHKYIENERSRTYLKVPSCTLSCRLTRVTTCLCVVRRTLPSRGAHTNSGTRTGTESEVNVNINNNMCMRFSYIIQKCPFIMGLWDTFICLTTIHWYMTHLKLLCPDLVLNQTSGLIDRCLYSYRHHSTYYTCFNITRFVITHFDITHTLTLHTFWHYIYFHITCTLSENENIATLFRGLSLRPQ